MPDTPAFARFMASTSLDYDKWHDGEGFDLDALAEMSDGERARIVELLAAREPTWREVEALAAIDLPAARAAVDAASQDARVSPDTRLVAAEAMHRQGRLDDFPAVLAREIRQFTQLGNGLTRALLLAEDHRADVVKRALLHASHQRNECAMHCAAVLCYVCGVTDEAFDWSRRPLFLRIAGSEGETERQAALKELCDLVGMRPEPGDA